VRFAVLSVVAIACASLACGAGVYPSNGAKLGEALAFATVAAAAQVAQTAAEQHARNNAPIRSSTGMRVSPNCDNEGQYGCVNVTTSPSDPAANAAPQEMSIDEAHDYVLGYVNGVRKLNNVGPLVRDESLDAFTQEASEELSQDHRQNQHMIDHARDLRARSTEVQGSPDGSPPGPLQDQIGDVLVRWMGEGPGGMHHDAILRPEWRRLGVGIVSRDGRTYFTVDFMAE
jgi:uncharacterized protein YkwD